MIESAFLRIELKMCVGNTILVSEMAVNKIKQLACKECNQKRKTNQIDEGVIREDILAVFTYYTKVVLFSCGSIFKNFEESKWYK